MRETREGSEREDKGSLLNFSPSLACRAGPIPLRTPFPFLAPAMQASNANRPLELQNGGRKKNSNKLKLKAYTSTRKSTFTLVTLQRFSISGVISAEKM